MRVKPFTTISCSPFDNTAVDLVGDLNAPAYKIKSLDAVNVALIKYVFCTGGRQQSAHHPQHDPALRPGHWLGWPHAK